jgi:hypothetical protein
MISSPYFRVKSVSRTVRGGKTLLKVEFDWPNDPNHVTAKNRVNFGGYEGFFVVSPDEKWVLYEFESRQKKGPEPLVYRGTMEYQGLLDGFPIPKRVDRQVLKMPRLELVRTYSYDYQDFRFTDLPDTEFALAAFGIPEHVAEFTAASERTSQLGAWLLSSAIASLAMAVLLKVASTRVGRSSRATGV